MKKEELESLLIDLNSIEKISDIYNYDYDCSEIKILEDQLETAYENIDKLKDILVQLINHLIE